jgi:transposase
VLLRHHQLKEVVFCLKPTGNHHKPLAHWLMQKGYSVVLVSGKAVNDNRELIDGRWEKNDTKDRADVADLISQGKCQFYEHRTTTWLLYAVCKLFANSSRKKNTDCECASEEG